MESQEQELPKELPECIDPNCSCIVNEKEIVVCTYCESLLNSTSTKSTTIGKLLFFIRLLITYCCCVEVEPIGRRASVGIPHKSGCQCNLPKCVCCKLQELQQNPESQQKCFCVRTEKGLLRCTLCESPQQGQKDGEAGAPGTSVSSFLRQYSSLLYFV